jgi:hypothetical protein
MGVPTWNSKVLIITILKMVYPFDPHIEITKKTSIGGKP